MTDEIRFYDIDVDKTIILYDERYRRIQISYNADGVMEEYNFETLEAYNEAVKDLKDWYTAEYDTQIAIAMGR